MTRPLALSLDDARATDPSETGGKGAALARLVRADLPVPGGFCVTTAAYRLLADSSAVREAVDSLAGLDAEDAGAVAAASTAVRDAVRDRTFPPEVRRAVEAALDGHDADAFAVRSSATAEDLPTASFAGQHETYLGVPTDEVLDRVRDCMASLFTDRAVTYRIRNGIAHEDVALAAVVQGMVDPDVSGILFTADPVSGNRNVASVDAGFGLGDALVSGAVTADNARVDRTTGEVVDYEVGDKAVAVRERGAGSGTETVELDPERRTARALSDGQLRALVDLGDRVESLLGGPQDVEWALVDGEFRLLQSRPITSLFPLPEPGPADDRLHVYLSFSHAQAMPEALPPLVVDLWRGFMNGGLASTSVAAREGRWAVSAGGRLYLDLTPLLRVDGLRRRLPGGVEAASEPAADGLRALLDRRSDDLPSVTAGTAARETLDRLRGDGPALVDALVGATGRFVRAFLVGPPAPERERRWVEEWGRDLASEVRAPDDTAARARAVFERYDFSTLLAGVFPRIGPLLLASVAARRALERLVPDAAADLDAVGKGFESEVVTRINQRLGDLADVAREHPAVADALREGASREDLEGVEGSGPFLAELDDFLGEFGHRATGEIDVGRPRWRDDPSGPLQSVRGGLGRDEAGLHRDHLADLERRAEAAADRLEARAARGPLGPLRRRAVRRLVRTYRGGIQLREYPKQGLGHLFAAWHDVLSAAGSELAADGRLDRADDVWFLRREELLDALERDAPVEADIAARRREFERYASTTAPPLLTSEGEDPTALVTRDVPPGTLVGTAVSSGVAEGTARVVRDPSTTGIEPGEIIVASSCDPGWTPLFLNAAGLVTEVGGRMTHGSVVAREYGLPAVVSVRDATAEIRSGERIRVDGTRGTVELLDRG